ncbi:hypothetical protein P3X46_000772 [Hevea brasiliensis]|uniref:F-box domain-containing protein n=1 Tax=Hevea brasiliensis TaxID=3981 RepID=A0ABQ9NAF4_HEVBR|nr:F-box/kelch-repeat protein At3g06240-like [Hevea brasiliensis]KAJ9189487.1 hypothetical protein P3X46_000772 [Hevea brasiliensis]
MAVDYLPKHLVLNILFRLPVICLIRFRCVCKSWCALFSDPNYIYKNLLSDSDSEDLNANPRVLVKFEDYNAEDFEDYAFSFLSSDTFDLSAPQEIPYPKDIIEKCSFIDIVGSCCNGLICLRDVYYVEDLLGLWDDIYDSESNIVLWNPTTTETKILPESNVPRPPHHSISLEIVEFGFDPRTSDCKVLRIFEYSSLDSQWDYLVEIYSLRDDTWRKVDVTLNAWILPSYKYCDGFFNDHRGHTGANGTFHWRTRYHSPEDVIVSFDLCNEVIKTTGLPDPVDSFESIFSLNEYVALPLHVPYHVELWVLLEYGVKESWTKLFTIAYPEVMRPCLPLGFSRNGELFFSDLGGQLLVWNPTTEAIARVQVGGRVPWKSLQTVTYRESHIPLKGGNQLEDEQNSGDAIQS